jgi:hypothetical protein
MSRVIDGYCRLLHTLGAVVRGEARPLVSARDGLANLRVAGAAKRASNLALAWH